MVSGMLSSVTGAVLTGTAGGRPADCAFGDCQALPSRSNVRLRIHTTMGIHRYTNPSETLVSTAYTNGRHSSLSRTEPTIYYLHRRRMAKHVPEFFERRRGPIGSTPMANHLVLGRRPPCSNVWTQIIRWSRVVRFSTGNDAHPPAIQWRSNWIEIVSIWESISPTVAVSCL